jgi:hypothetical protein
MATQSSDRVPATPDHPHHTADTLQPSYIITAPNYPSKPEDEILLPLYMDDLYDDDILDNYQFSKDADSFPLSSAAALSCIQRYA